MGTKDDLDADLVATPPVMHTFDEAAAIAGISKRYLQLRVADGTGPDVTRIGRRALVRADRLTAWLDQLTEGAKAQMENDEMTHAALTVLAAVRQKIVNNDPEAM